jgi:RNA-directed DNA polymerase
MIKAPINLQDLRRRLYVKAKTEPTWRFWGLYGHVCKRETLQQAYRLAKANDGAPGVDGVTFEAVEAEGVERFLDQLHQELAQRTYRPQKARKVEIPKGGGKMRQLSIPSIRDRVVQGALKLILEPIFEADFQPGSFGYRPKKSAHTAIQRVSTAILEGKTYVIDFDLRSYFDTVRHHIVLEKVARRVDDEAVLWLLKLLLEASGKQGVPQGGVMTPRTQKVTSNLSGGCGFGVNRVRIDACRRKLYVYDRCHAPAVSRRPSDSIAPWFYFSKRISFPMLSNNWRRIAPFHRVKPTVTSSRLSN